MKKYEITCHDDADVELTKAFIAHIFSAEEDFTGSGIGTPHTGLNLEFFGPQSAAEEPSEIPLAVADDFSYLFCRLYESGGMGSFSAEYYVDRGGAVINEYNDEIVA